LLLIKINILWLSINNLQRSIGTEVARQHKSNFLLELERAKLIESEKLFDFYNFPSLFRFVSGIANPKGVNN